MPVTHLHIKWTDNSKDKIYSPSSIIAEYFSAGQTLNLDEFDELIQKALHSAIERVKQVYGFECSAARGELENVKSLINQHEAAGDDTVKIIRIE